MEANAIPRRLRPMMSWRVVVLLIAGLSCCAQSGSPAPSRGRSGHGSTSVSPPERVVTARSAQYAAPVSPEVEPAAAPRRHLPLHDAFPDLVDAFPVAPIGQWPTPVSDHPALARALGVAKLLIKRDDESAEPYGGGKPRKLELLLGRARADGHHTVVTFGGVGSHHAIATALYAQRLGMKAVLMLLPQPRTDEVREVLLGSFGAGAELVMAGSMKTARRRAAARRAANPDDVTIIAAGGSEPLGNVGFISAGIELAGQIRRGEVDRPDVIFMALGTMGSAIGLDIGLVAANMPIPIVAVRASSQPISRWDKLERMYANTVAFVRAASPSFPDVTLDPERFRIEARFLGKGYAQPTSAGAEAVRFAAEHHVALDPTYTAKTFAALRAAAARGELAGDKVLFWQSHDSQPLDVSHVDPMALPADFRGWVAP
jgi:1-aminocyclopropane-1-carboxylate deaminase/D-cysteine desulfhydrase-like pyridoxal-dependent ACC family enzyme